MRLTASQIDRAVGVVLASAAGDALGAGYEFGPPVTGPVEMNGGGPFGWAPGEWTDDTQMASAILSAGVAAREEGRALSVLGVAEGFVSWFRSGPADIGVQTRAVLSAAGSAKELAAAAARFQAGRPEAAGNGSLMRTGPVAVCTLDLHEADVARLAGEISDLTHPHPDCSAACVLWSVAIHRLLHRASAEAPAEGWVELVAGGLDLLSADVRDRWAGLVEECRTGPVDRFAAQNGWVVAAFQQALTTLETTRVPDGEAAPTHLPHALEAAVRPGGDTDTVAAITGSLAGAAWGATAIPHEWREPLNGLAASATTVERIDGHELDRRAQVAVGAREGKVTGG